MQPLRFGCLIQHLADCLNLLLTALTFPPILFVRAPAGCHVGQAFRSSCDGGVVPNGVRGSNLKPWDLQTRQEERHFGAPSFYRWLLFQQPANYSIVMFIGAVRLPGDTTYRSTSPPRTNKHGRWLHHGVLLNDDFFNTTISLRALPALRAIRFVVPGRLNWRVPLAAGGGRTTTRWPQYREPAAKRLHGRCCVRQRT